MELWRCRQDAGSDMLPWVTAHKCCEDLQVWIADVARAAYTESNHTFVLTDTGAVKHGKHSWS
eukprot:1157599-Pelagomonas_calceolata.AAC.2